MMIKTKKVDNKKRIIIIREVSGIDKTKEAVLAVMGEGYEYKTDEELKAESENKLKKV